MKYWADRDVLERNISEGEAILDRTNPHPAYKGVKLLSTGGDRLYEVEIVPGTARMESIINPDTLTSIIGNVCTVLYRTWNDDLNEWNEQKFPSLLAPWGYDSIPETTQSHNLSNFDRAMKGI